MEAVELYSHEAECSVIGALLIDNNAIDGIGELREEHFFRHEHKQVFALAYRMIGAGKPCDIITLAEELHGQDDGVNWLLLLGEIQANTPGASNINRYAQIVRDRSMERALLAASAEIKEIVSDRATPVAEKVDAAQAKVMALSDGIGEKQVRSITAVMTDCITFIDEGRDGKVNRTPTGYADIDNRLDMLTPGDLVIVAARPSMGKTTFAMNIAESVAIDKGLPVAVFSMEMSDMQLGLRMLSSVGRIDAEKLRRRQMDLTVEEFNQMSAALGKITNASIHIDDRPALTLNQVRLRARAIKRKHGLGLIVIDYLQLMSGEGGSGKESRHEVVATLSRGLKALAKDLDIPVIALSQLNRGLEQRPNKRPVMSDLRESGQIEQDADVIAFLYRDEVYNPDTPDIGTAEVIFSKVRNGVIGTVRLAFVGEHSRFDNLSREWVAAETSRQAEPQTRGFRG